MGEPDCVTYALTARAASLPYSAPTAPSDSVCATTPCARALVAPSARSEATSREANLELTWIMSIP